MPAGSLRLRDSQAECIEIIYNLDGGAHLVHIPTGLGKTVAFASVRLHLDQADL